MPSTLTLMEHVAAVADILNDVHITSSLVREFAEDGTRTGELIGQILENIGEK